MANFSFSGVSMVVGCAGGGGGGGSGALRVEGDDGGDGGDDGRSLSMGLGKAWRGGRDIFVLAVAYFAFNLLVACLFVLIFLLMLLSSSTLISMLGVAVVAVNGRDCRMGGGVKSGDIRKF